MFSSLHVRKHYIIIFVAFQGMNEMLLNFLVVFEHESDAYWCFSNYMTSVKSDFDEVGMLEKVQLVQTVLHKVEPNLSW